MITIASTSNTAVKMLLLPLNYTQLYNKLKLILNSREISFFTKPEGSNSDLYWTYDVSSTTLVKKFSQLNSDDQENFINELELLKSDVLFKLNKSQDKDLKQIADKLFIIPNKDSLKALFIDNQWKFIITEWGCLNLIADKGTDVISNLFAIPRSNSDIVILNFFEKQSKTSLSHYPFILEYQGIALEYSTDQSGIFNRGRCIIGSKFSIKANSNHKLRDVETFEVIKDDFYNVYISDFQNISINIINQNKEPITGKEFSLLNANKSFLLKSNENGEIFFDDIEIGTEFTITDKRSNQNVNLMVEKGKFTYECDFEQNESVQVSIQVVNTDNIPISMYEISIEKNKNSSMLLSDSNGMIFLENCYCDEEIFLLNPKNPINTLLCTVQKKDNQFVFTVTENIIPEITFTFIDYKQRPIKNRKVILKVGNKKIKLKTNNNGICIIKATELEKNQSVKVSVSSLFNII